MSKHNVVLRTPEFALGTAHRAHAPTQAILLITASVLCFTILDTITKFTTRHYPVPVLVWARYAVQLIAMLVWLYVMANVLVFGAELNWWAAARRNGRDEEPETQGLA